MGYQMAKSANEVEVRTQFIRHLLNDIKCMEIMLERGMIESGIHRIGAEQEFCLISQNWRPNKNSELLLANLKDDHFTTELARFNMEINLDPVDLKGDCFTQVEDQLRDLLSKAKKVAEKEETYVLLTGILPTISKTEMAFDYMTPLPRYWALNEMVKGIRGTDFHLHIKGVDELSVKHDSVLMEACNTSFQMHLQVDPEDFVKSYNWSQAIAGPVLGVCANSPLLLGRELWSETRIALFQQSIDTRTSTYALKDQNSRVSFGEFWETGTAADVFKNDIAQHKVLLARPQESDSLEDLKKGITPKLKALNLHNGTIYRWNRPCYGVGNGKAHLRIENRYIPAGPTIIDQMANFAFWVGLMLGRSDAYSDLTTSMDFRDIKSNFIKAARTGKESVLRWRERQVSVRDLVTRELLPIAYEGLGKANIESKTINKLLGIIEERAVGQTGAQWSIKSYRKLKANMKQDDALLALTKTMYENQVKDIPVHDWEECPDYPDTHEHATQIGHVMSTRLFTVYEDDLAEMATQIMEWKNIHHVPVENKSGEVSGLLTWTHMERYKEKIDTPADLSVNDIMAKDIFLGYPEMLIKEAIDLMKQNEIGCLPIVHNQHLVGIVTIKDLIKFDNDQRSQ
ncbi:CBS domain-containing protein [Ekhidna sp.]|uniref:CBS domain-containing protein n=1 Tax=Ekhidna sp. TaxID=2608089 RepID=UPI003BAD40A2